MTAWKPGDRARLEVEITRCDPDGTASAKPRGGSTYRIARLRFDQGADQ